MGAETMPDGQLTRFEFIHPDQLHAYWPTIRPGVESVMRESGNGWIPEDVYLSLKLQQSTLHVGYVDNRYQGFVVLTPTKVHDGSNLHIWLTYSEPSATMLPTFFPAIRECAEAMRAKRITFHSSRPGWARVAPTLGFEATQTIYECEV